MTRPLAMLMIGLFFGSGLGFVVAASNGVSLNGHDHGSHAHDEGHNHEPIALGDDIAAPRVAFDLERDAKSGWNLHIETENFRFSPETVNGPHVPGEGHAHIYVNDQKRARLYGPWYHLEELPEGNVTVGVTLHANNHRPLMANNTIVKSSKTITNN